ncbi:alpha/beta hydrolase-fold protein [Roseivivax isoporae]|uniref:Alpha/beta hydrolase n=1 Tax=Roseivivax isoporae LMG 25204 TaxID=1449351 RepID=X7FCY6_9RHOB|nr:alpha/beta hydrolase-fold protein [Roseivivax isoporae]ETX30588.1 hypothetical protein RISW2_12445 [Roseivivax isoporae LMG 25204]
MDAMAMSGQAGEVRTLVADADLMVRALPGTNARLVLSFTGVQHGMGQIPADEFIGSAAGAGRNHVLFVSDLARTWFTRAGLQERIVDIVTHYAAEHGIADMAAIGNSMGGYGALLLSDRLPLSVVAAFAPQVSMDATVVAEPRWPEFRAGFGPDLPASVAGPVAAARGTVFVTMGAQDALDRRHMALLPEAAHVHRFLLRGCGHNTASFLKERGVIREVVAAMLAGEVDRVRALYAGVGLAEPEGAA